jgi:subtilase family serine protease
MRTLIFAALAAAALPALAQNGPLANRIVGLLDPNRSAPLKGNIHPQASRANDLGPAPRDLTLDSITLHLKPTPAQQADLDQFLVQLQTPSSAEYRRWLTPEQYADRFGASPADIAQITAWLEQQGLTVTSQARGRNFVTFQGAVDQVEAALHTSIHRYLVDGETHFANATEPSVPAAIESFTAGFSGLHDFKPQAPPHPQAVSQGYGHVLAPFDLWNIYDTTPLVNAGFSGQGMKLAVIGQTDINLSDITAYQTGVQLSPTKLPVKVLAAGSANPGITSDVSEAAMDLELADAMAPNAEILYVYATNVYASAGYAIDQNLAPVISFSYAGCEVTETPPSAAQTVRQAVQQANAQGITWVASSGDNGATGCDYTTPATHGFSAMFPASIPEVTAVGGTQLSDWSASSLNATSYLPEVAWNDENKNKGASGGGVSIYFPKPSWQSGPGIPPGVTQRWTPDVAFSASPQHLPYFVVYSGSGHLMGGTSAAAPVFAGIVLLLNQALGASGLGNINPALYSLASNPANVCNTNAVTPTCVFHDITTGDNGVPCLIGSVGCTSGVLGYVTTPGYDVVTGLGSVDAAKLAHAWKAPTPTPTPTSILLSATHASFAYTLGASAPASQTVTVSENPSALPWTASSNASWLTVSPASGAGSETLVLGIHTSGLSAQTYNGAVTVTAPGATNSPQTISVVLTVKAAGTKPPPATGRPTGNIGALTPNRWCPRYPCGEAPPPGPPN